MLALACLQLPTHPYRRNHDITAIKNSYLKNQGHSNVTVFWKINRMDTNTEIHFLPVDESHTHALFRDTEHLRLDGQVCFYRRLFSDAVKPRGCLSWPPWPLRGINNTAWAAKLGSDGRPGLPCELCRSGSLIITDGKPLPFEFECLLYPAYGSPPAPTPLPTAHPL